MTNPIYYKEMDKLAEGLNERNFKYLVHPLQGGLQIDCGDWDAICHDYSFGHENGLLEVMGLPQCDDDVIGYLTAEQVLEMVDEIS
jgi:hypothetical protein